MIFARVQETYPALLSAHQQVITRAAKKRRNPTTQRTHSFELIDFLAEKLGKLLPQPDYPEDTISQNPLSSSVEDLQIDPFLFDRQFQRFRQYVIDQSTHEFRSFSSHPYTESQEGYKYNLYRDGRSTLAFEAWQKSDIGTGVIAHKVITAIELPQNNLVPWQSRHGDAARPHHRLYLALAESSRLAAYEEVLYRFYSNEADEGTVFNDLARLFGRQYSLIAYLFFLKDRSRYMPIATTYFDRAFQSLGVNFITTQQCSWENYTTYNRLLSEIKTLLSEYLEDVSLLDAHSFAWILSKKMGSDKESADIAAYQSLPKKEREAIVNARIGQGRFRNSLIQYWLVCAVTGCREQSLLKASHIKPWKACSPSEAIDPCNGLLLSPALDAAFDAGYVSFTDTGEILISETLSAFDVKALALDPSMQLSRVDPRHHSYLDYHRTNIFKKASEAAD